MEHCWPFSAKIEALNQILGETTVASLSLSHLGRLRTSLAQFLHARRAIAADDTRSTIEEVAFLGLVPLLVFTARALREHLLPSFLLDFLVFAWRWCFHFLLCWRWRWCWRRDDIRVAGNVFVALALDRDPTV